MSHESPQQPNGHAPVDPQQPIGQQPYGHAPAGATSPHGVSGGKRTSVLGVWGARVVLIVVAACALVSVVFILTGAGGDTLARVVTTDVALIVFALLVWLDTVIGAYRPEWFEFASLATDAYLLLLWIVTIWAENGSGPLVLWVDIWRGILSLLFVRGMLALVDLVRFLYSRWVTTVTRILAYVSAVSFAAIAVLVTIPAPTPFNALWDYDVYGRIVASLAVIAGVALVLIPLWGLLINRNRNTPRRTPAYGPAAGGDGGAYSGAAYGGTPYGGPSFGATFPGAGPTGYPLGVPPVPVSQAPASAGYPQGATAVTSGSVPADPSSPQQSAAAQPPLAWPRLANGYPVPVGPTGDPDFAAVAGAPLAWPTFTDGTPVPAAPDGSPLYR